MKNWKLLALGDIVGTPTKDWLCGNLWALRREYGIDFVVANAENVCMGSGNGLDAQSAQELLLHGVDVLTGGNHIFARQNLYSFLEDSDQIVRPANYPDTAPGKGAVIAAAGDLRILVANVMGQCYMDSVDDPFVSVEKLLRRHAGDYDLAFLDIHAEATAEKAAIARCFDGKIAICVGTHTHVQTADARLLPRGTAFLSDLGMCGPDDSILGVTPESILHKLRTKLPTRFALAQGNGTLNGAIVTLDGVRPTEIALFSHAIAL